MTPDQFLLVADPLPEPMLLLTGDGLILAGNHAAAARLGAPAAGRPLAEVVADAPADVAGYLRTCARGRALALGALTPRAGGACRAEGSLVRPKSADGDALVMLRLLPKEPAVGQFVALNQQIDDLNREIQRRKQAEDDARRQEERLRVTLLSIGDAVIVTAPDGRVTTMNPVAEILTGWAAAEAAGRPLEDVFRIVNEATRAPVENPAHRALRDGVIVGLANHTVLIAKDGAERPIDDSGAPIRDGRGGVVGAVLVFRDITERKATEAAIFANEERYREFVANSTEGVYRLEFDPPADTALPPDAQIDAVFAAGRFAECNDAFARMYGYAGAADVIGRGLDLMMPPAEPAVRDFLRGAIAAGYRVAEAESEERDKDGRPVFFSNSLVGVVEAGRLTRVWGTQRDVTARVRAEAESRRIAEQLRLVTDAVPALISYVDSDGRYRFNNKAYEDWFGHGREEIHGRHMREILGDAAFERVRPFVEAALAGRRVEAEVEVPYKDGGTRFIHAAYVPDTGADGVTHGYYALVTDITQNKQTEAALREADRRKDEFLATLAHELRNPLAPLGNGLHVLKAPGAGAEDVREARGMMERQLAHMVRLIDDLLDLSRISRGKVELRRERVELATVVRNAVETSRPLIEREGHHLTVAVPPEPLYVDADVTRLSQVFANLLNNAAKYTDRGGRLRLAVERHGGDTVVTVRDNGVGIPAPMLPQVFDMFTQVDRSLEKAKGGLGIGLTLVKRLVELHGGTVEARSDGDGLGSEFVVRLPAAPAAADQSGPAAAAPAGPAARRRILVVDDNRDSAVSLAMVLEIMGNDTRTAHDGLEALEVAETFRPEVVLLDIGMPKLNGYDTARRLRAEPWGKRVLLVAQTGWGQEDDKRKSRDAGFDHHLVKPVDPAALEKLLAGLPAKAE